MDDFFLDFLSTDALPDDPDRYWWRATISVDDRAPVYDMNGEFTHFIDRFHATAAVLYHVFKVERTTSKGVWLEECYDFRGLSGRRFVLRDARKRWACPTRAEALESLTARTERRVTILTAQLRTANIALHYLKKGTLDGYHG